MTTSDEPKYWPPKIRWAAAFGWLNIQDPWTGEWFSIPAKEAPRGYARIAMREKEERRNAGQLGQRTFARHGGDR